MTEPVSIKLEKSPDEKDKYVAPGLCPVCALTLSPTPPIVEDEAYLGCTKCCSFFKVRKDVMTSLTNKDMNEMLPALRFHLKEFAKMALRSKGKPN